MTSVVRRSAVLLVALSLLSGLGMPLRQPCCALSELAPAVAAPDCCPMPDCCRGEKRGATPFVVSASSAAAHIPALFARPWREPARNATFRDLARTVVEFASLHGPPEAARDLSILLSTLRV